MTTRADGETITYELVLRRAEDLAPVAAWASGMGVEVLFGRGTRLRIRASLAHVRALAELTAVALVVAWLPAGLREAAGARRRAAEARDPRPFDA